MREILDDVDRWLADGQRIALARVVDVEGSGPRGPGAAMAVNERGEVAGSVSGGCVEGAVVTEALDILAGRQPSRVVTFGYSDDEAFAVGLTCGGTIRLFIEPVTTDAEQAVVLRERIRSQQPVAHATIIDGPNTGASMVIVPGAPVLGSLGTAELDRVVSRDALAELEAARSGVRHYGPQGETTPEDLIDSPTVRVFVESHAPPPQMWIFGAVDFTAALAKVAKVLGYRVTVCDAREIFATRRRFPMADEVVVSWPGPLFETRGATLAARDAGYVGIMGSRTTHEKRLERLREAGVSDEDLTRLMSPIGLDLGARTPEETAISICAEIIAAKTGHAVPSLRDSAGPIHA
jgi:xanthine dehydrogenase accessory factor